MHQKYSRTVLALALALASACAPADAPAYGRTEFIVDGVRERGENAVVWIYNRRGGLCSGTIIAPRVVLTAKHCVQQSGASAPDPASFFQIGVGDSLRSVTDVLSAVDVRTTPGVYTSGSSGGLGGALVGVDVALLTLQRGVDTVVPIEIKRDPPTDQIGREAIAIGFGQTPAGETGVKYRTTTTVRGIMGGVVYTGPATCQGDSGGPILDAVTHELYAVTSFGTGSCGSGIAGANRIDLFLEMIDEVIGASGACLNDGPERCDGFDNDCNDMIDETCLAIGEACVSRDECIGNNCADTPGGRICTQPCDPLRPAVGCPVGLFCARVSGCDGVCIPEPPGARARAVGEACDVDAECVSLFCIDPGDGRRRCLQPCRSGDGLCLAGEACAAPFGACGGCVPEEILAAARQLGEPCGADAECASGRCLVEAETAYCTAACDGDAACPSGFHCRVDLCVRGHREGTGGGCLANDDCEPGLICAARGTVRWCTPFCSDDMPCPDDFECVPAGGAFLCAPTGRLVGEECMTADECISRTCTETDDGSVCTRMCSPEAPCAPGFECHRTDAGDSAVCVAPSPEVVVTDEGCSCSPAGPLPSRDAPWSLVWVGTFLFFLRRRR